MPAGRRREFLREQCVRERIQPALGREGFGDPAIRDGRSNFRAEQGLFHKRGILATQQTEFVADTLGDMIEMVKVGAGGLHPRDHPLLGHSGDRFRQKRHMGAERGI